MAIIRISDRSPFRWTPQMDDTLTTMWRAGRGITMINQALGYTGNAAVARRARALDLGPHPSRANNIKRPAKANAAAGDPAVGRGRPREAPGGGQGVQRPVVAENAVKRPTAVSAPAQAPSPPVMTLQSAPRPVIIRWRGPSAATLRGAVAHETALVAAIIAPAAVAPPDGPRLCAWPLACDGPGKWAVAVVKGRFCERHKVMRDKRAHLG